MDLFELGLLTARAGKLGESRVLLKEALENEARAADLVAKDYALEPTRSILCRSAASIALRIGDTEQAKRYVDAGLAGNPPEDIKGELAILNEQILVLEAATADYRLRAPKGLTVIEQISRRFRSTAPVNISGLARALGLAVRQAALDPGTAGEIFPDLYRGGPSGYTVRVNASDSIKQKRLTIAHEIAHFLRHRDRIGRGHAVLEQQQNAGKTGDGRRQHKGCELVAVGRVAEKARTLLVLADRHQHAADGRMVEAPQQDLSLIHI